MSNEQPDVRAPPGLSPTPNGPPLESPNGGQPGMPPMPGLLDAVPEATKEQKTTDMTDEDYDQVAEGLILDVTKELFFHGMLSNDETNQLLKANGDWLLRTPEKTHAQAMISMRVVNEVKDFPLTFVKTGKDLKERQITLNGTYTKNNINDLIKDHMGFSMPVGKDPNIVLGSPVARMKWTMPRELLTMEAVIGEGAFGQVWSGKLKPEKGDAPPSAVAVKVTKLSEENKCNVEEMMKEARIMRQLQHTNVVTFYGVIEEAEKLMIVMELINGAGLDRYLKKNKPSMEDKYSFCYDVASGLAYLHSKRFMHRDMAARNCLIDTQKFIVKISDFGMSKQVEQYKIQATERTPIRWQAPEVMRTAVYTKECDVYSYAIVMYEIFTDGEAPFKGIENKEIRARIQDPKFRPALPASLPSDVMMVAQMAWHGNPKMRISMRMAEFTLAKYCKHMPEHVKNAMNQKLSVTPSQAPTSANTSSGPSTADPSAKGKVSDKGKGVKEKMQASSSVKSNKNNKKANKKKSAAMSMKQSQRKVTKKGGKGKK